MSTPDDSATMGQEIAALDRDSHSKRHSPDEEPPMSITQRGTATNPDGLESDPTRPVGAHHRARSCRNPRRGSQVGGRTAAPFRRDSAGYPVASIANAESRESQSCMSTTLSLAGPKR